VDQSRDFKVLQTPQPLHTKSEKRWNIGKINTFIIYAHIVACVLTWLILVWNKKLNWDRCKISHFLKQPSGGFLKGFFFFFSATDTTSANIYALWDGRSQCKLSFYVFQESQKNMPPVSDNSLLGKPRYELHLEVVPPAVPCWYLQEKCFLKRKKKLSFRKKKWQYEKIALTQCFNSTKSFIC
jgi:hypothetical protein